MKTMFLNVSQLCVHYAGRTQRAVDNASFTLAAGEIGVLIGPSGCGKTTLLRTVAGFITQASGRVSIDGAEQAIVADLMARVDEYRLKFAVLLGNICRFGNH